MAKDAHTKKLKRLIWRDRPLPSFFDRHKSFLKNHREEPEVDFEESVEEFAEVVEDSIDFSDSDPVGIDQVSQLLCSPKGSESPSTRTFFSPPTGSRYRKGSQPSLGILGTSRISYNSPDKLASSLRQRARGWTLVDINPPTASAHLSPHNSTYSQTSNRNSAISSGTSRISRSAISDGSTSACNPSSRHQSIGYTQDALTDFQIHRDPKSVFSISEASSAFGRDLHHHLPSRPMGDEAQTCFPVADSPPNPSEENKEKWVDADVFQQTKLINDIMLMLGADEITEPPHHPFDSESPSPSVSPRSPLKRSNARRSW